jgi:Ca2+-binding RTX toxin-like protein
MATPAEWLNEFQVNTGTAATGSQSDPKIIGLNNGGFVVAWVEAADGGIAGASPAGTDIIAKIYDAEGNVVRDSFRLNSDRNFDDERDFDLTATHDGFAMAYIDDSIPITNQKTVYYERFDFDGSPQVGTGNAHQIADENVAADDLFNPQIAANLIASDDDVMVAFTQSVGTADDEVIGRVVDEAGALGAEFDAGSNSSGQNRLGDVAVLSNGNFVTVYTENDTVQGIEFRIVTPTGASVSNVNVTDAFTGGVAASEPSVASLAGGGFVVTWTEGGDILAHVYSDIGTSLSAELTVAGGANIQNEPVVVGLPDGDFVVAWDDDSSNNLFARRFNSDGTSDGVTFTVENVNTSSIDISVTGDGRILFAWQDLTTGEISASVWDPRSSTIDPDDYNVELAHVLNSNVITTRTSSTTVLAASDSEDYFVFGQNGNDSIFSNGFGEYLGGAGNDTITAGNGTDGTGRVELLDGGVGIDTIDITLFGGTYGINLATGVTTFNGAVVTEESFINFENVIAGAGNNMVTGTSGANFINTGGGDDTIVGGAGLDTINAGDGNDTVFWRPIPGSSGTNGDSGSVYDGGAGTDVIHGGDTFFGLVTFDLGAGTYTSGPFTQTWTNFENYFNGNAIGSERVLGSSADNRIETGSGNNALTGEGGNDTLIGGGGNDTLDGGSGNDTIFGGDGNDSVVASSGSDLIRGGNGNDTLRSSGTDTIFGDDGDDLIFSGLGLPESLDGGTGIDTLDTTTFNGTYVVNLATGLTNFGGELFLNFENIISGNGNDELFGTIGANAMSGGGGNDRIKGFAGNDTLNGDLGNDTLVGGDGNDVMNGGDGIDRFFGQVGNDLIDGGLGNDSIEGNVGNDTILGGAGDDLLRGADGFDSLVGGDGNDTAFGGNDNDTLLGGLGDDSLDGSGGNDFIDGGDGNDVVVGETGADSLIGGNGNDTLRGGGGNDTMNGQNDDDLMFGSSGEDVMFGGAGNDVLEGDTQSDQLFGQSGNDTLRGGDGFDFLDGGTDNDVLAGGNGNDTLIGNLGQDILRGNAGNDTFRFFSSLDSSFGAEDIIDGIDGVGVAGGDIIDLLNIDANTTIAGNQAFTFLGNVSSAVGIGFGAGALWVENAGGQTRLYGNTDNDAVIELAIFINDGALVTAADYTAGDFIL